MQMLRGQQIFSADLGYCPKAHQKIFTCSFICTRRIMNAHGFVEVNAMRIAVCDDQLDAGTKCCQGIKAFLAQISDAPEGVQLYQEAAGLLADYQAGRRFDVIFLDIEMPGISGLEAAKRLREQDSEVLLIFCTGFPDYMPASFKVEAFDFLTKPASALDIAEVLWRCQQKLDQRCGHIVVKTASGLVSVLPHKVVLVRSDLHYVEFIFRGDDQPLRAKLKLAEAEALLAPYLQFARCHQSYIVNLDQVQELAGRKLLLTGPEPAESRTIPISRKYQTAVKAAFLRRHLSMGRKG